MSLDVKYFTMCDHFCNGKSYRPDMCPKCLNKGYLLDIAFDESGQTITADKEIKLQSECLKVLLDDKTSDLFHPYWGSEISSFIGKKKTESTKQRLEMVIRQCVERLKQIQIAAAETNPYFNEHEILKDIEYIELEPLSVTEWRCKIIVSNIAGDIIESEFKL